MVKGDNKAIEILKRENKLYHLKSGLNCIGFFFDELTPILK